MKEKLLALAALTLAGAASAQSSVTMFGVVDLAYAYGSTSANHLARIRESGNTTSRIGLRGSEDLGGGLSAGFWLEAGMDPSDGQGGATNTNNQASGTGAASAGRQGLTFNRRSIVYVRGSWGELRAGRDYTPSFWNLTLFDAFGTTGVGTSQLLNSGALGLIGVTAVRASNAVTYSTPGCSDPIGCSGFYGQAQVILGENASDAPGGTSKDGSGAGVHVGYGSGPFTIAIGHGKARYATGLAVGDTTQSNLGLSYKMGGNTLKALFVRDQRDSAIKVVGTGYQIGANIPMGANEVRASWGVYKTDQTGSPKTSKLSLGYVHHMSKRTALYGTVARLANSGGATQALNGATGVVNGGSTGYDIGIKHSF